MTLKKLSLAIATLMLVAPLSASALGISIAGVSSTGGNTSLLAVGDTITFDLVLENADNLDILGLGVGAYGYDAGAQGDPTDNRLVFAGGQAADSIFNTSIQDIPSFGLLASGGLETFTGPQENGQGFPISDTLRVNLLQAGLPGTTTNGNGTLDVGIDGLQTNGSDAHIRVSFTANFTGNVNYEDVTLTFGTGQFGNEVLDAAGQPIGGFNNTSYTVRVVPEPGTALLMGLGLAGLAARRR